jgi:methylated-DNA-[protein]-cysteine S-methyltransferase
MNRTARTARRYALLSSPLGQILLTFGDGVLTGLYFMGQKDQPAIGPDWILDDADPLVARMAGQLQRYFEGAAVEFDVPVRLDGTPFQQRVWEALRAIPPGRTLCYGDVARQVGAVAAVRAVGAAIGRNPVSIVVPCHRVIGRNGTLTGYAGGLERKQRLLQLEGVL